MFDNIGDKIQRLAKAVIAIGVVVAVVCGIVMLIQATDERETDGFGIFMAFGVMIVGSLLSWIAGFLVGGFGRLVQNSDILAGRMTLEQVSAGDIQQRIVALDKQYKQGAISEENYECQREALIDLYFQQKSSDQ